MWHTYFEKKTFSCFPWNSLHKKMKFSIKDFFSKCYQNHTNIYWKNYQWETSFFVQWLIQYVFVLPRTFHINVFGHSYYSITPCEKCPNTEFFLVFIFLYSVWIQENRDQKKLRIWALFTRCYICNNLLSYYPFQFITFVIHYNPDINHFNGTIA